MVQWLRIWASTVEGTGSIPGQGSSICYRYSQKKNHTRTKRQEVSVVENVENQNLIDYWWESKMQL